MGQSELPSTWEDDTSDSLYKLRHQAGKPLSHSVVEIYNYHRTLNAKSIEFWRNLTCFLPEKSDSKTRHQDHRQSGKIRLESRSPRHGYAAVSYSCDASANEDTTAEKYRLSSQMWKPLDVRDIVLDRTFRFIRYQQAPRAMIPLWIDKLSIDQDDSAEREIAMQSMDLVYKRCTYAIDYLSVQLQTQMEINRLSDLLGGRIVRKKVTGRGPTLLDGINKEVLHEVLDLLTRITNDRWWTRAWIFQENYLAETRMWLIIRHSNGIQKPLKYNNLGALRNEVVVELHKFKIYATLFCLACCNRMGYNPIVTKQCKKILGRAGRYNIIHRYQFNKADNIQKPMTVSIFTDLGNRNMESRPDILALAANVCGYDVRFATNDERLGIRSLSLGILALYVCNGELLGNVTGAVEQKLDVFRFLEDNSLYICAPLRTGQLTLIKHCRLSVLDICSIGIHTKGVLWRLGDVISPRYFTRGTWTNTGKAHPQALYRRGLSRYQRNRLLGLLKVLQHRRGRNKRLYQSITNNLTAYLQLTDFTPTHDEWPPKHSMNAMASGIVDAMDTGKYLQLARPVGGSLDSGRGVPYRAILIRDHRDLQSAGPTHIFTSWSRTKKQNQGEMETKRQAKYVSIEVGVDQDTSDGTVRLKTKKWVNGLCFFDGERKFPFIFEWPESLSR
jgi:hypothetical protein